MDASAGDSDAGAGDPDASAGDPDAGEDELEPVLRGVVPETGHPGRTVDVVALFDNLAPDAVLTSLSFGPGITIDSTTVLSDTALGVQLTIALDAEIGTRDVAVDVDGESITGVELFGVSHSLDIDVTEGSPVQGGVVEVTVDNLDDTSFFPDFLFEGGLWLVEERERGPSSWRGVVAIDPLAPSMAPFGIAQTTFTFEPTLHFTAEPASVAAGTPTEVPLTIAGGSVFLDDQVIDAPLGTQVYKISTAEAGVVIIGVRPKLSTIIDPVVSVVPGSGSYQDVLGTDAGSQVLVPVSSVATDLYLVVRDRGHGGGNLADYGFRVTSALNAVVAVDEQASPHATVGTAQAVAGDSVVQGELAAGDDQDVYTATLTAGGSDGASLLTDADLELGVSCGGGSTTATLPTRRPYERTTTFLLAGAGGATGCVFTVRPRPGIIGRPTGTYTLTIF